MSAPDSDSKLNNTAHGGRVLRIVVRLRFWLWLALNSWEVAALMHAAAECPARRRSAEEDRNKLYKKRLKILVERSRAIRHNADAMARRRS